MGFFSEVIGPVLGFIGEKEANDSAKNAAARDSYNNSPQGIRANAEQAGFNPLTVLTSGRSFGAGYQPQFGNALGHLGQGITDAINGREQLKIQKAELEIERRRVDQLAKAMTLGPKIPGIYGARSGYGTSKRSGKTGAARALPSDPSVPSLGGSGGSQRIGSPNAGLAPHREVDRTPFTSGPGIIDIDNAFTDFMGGPVVVPGDGGEPWGVDELAGVAISAGPQIIGRGGVGMTLTNPRRPMISAAEAKKIREERDAKAQKKKRPKARPKRSSAPRSLKWWQEPDYRPN